MAEQAWQRTNKAPAQARESDLMGHVAVRPWAGLERQPAREASPARGQDNSHATVRAAAPLVGREYGASTCPLAPTRCPYGGACHACPTRVQAKLAIGQPDDEYEQEADRIAGQIMQAPGMQVQRRAAGEADPADVPPIVHEVLRSPGKPLDAETRAFMEPRFGRDLSQVLTHTSGFRPARLAIDAGRNESEREAEFLARQVEDRSSMSPGVRCDFSGVRIHTDARAAESAQALNALAYTVGRDVVFGPGQYAPGTHSGMHLLAHELAHTVQQGALQGPPQSLVAGPLRVGAPGTASEQEADRAGVQVAAGREVTLCQTAGPILQRAEQGTYVSTLGDRPFLDAGASYYRSWGHPNVRRVSNFGEVLEGLDRSRGPIDSFRIVSHASAGGLQLGLLPTIQPEWFSSTAAQYTTPQRFRNDYTLLQLISNNLFNRLVTALRVDATTGPLMTAIGAGGTTAIAADSDLGIMLCAMLESYWLRNIQLDIGGAPRIANHQVIQDFINRRLTTYRRLVVANAGDRDQRRAAERAITRLARAIPGAVAAAEIPLTPITQADADTLADPFTDPQARPPRLAGNIATAIAEGANGPYVRRLRRVRTKINENTHIEIRGCNLGRSPVMLQSLRQFFGPPGHLPSISAPDLFQYFFALSFQTFTNRPADEQALQTAYNTPATGVARSFEDERRRAAGEMIRAGDDMSLADAVRRYSVTVPLRRVQQLNPEILDTAYVPAATAIWLAPRTSARPGRYRTLTEFCREYVGNEYAWPTVWGANPGIDPSRLDPDQPLQVPARLFATQVAAPAPTFTDYTVSLRGGRATVSIEQQTDLPVAHLDDRQRAAAIGDWLARQRFDTRGRTAAALSALYRRNFARVMAGTWVEFLSHTYPNVVDPIFPEDRRYGAHIIHVS